MTIADSAKSSPTTGGQDVIISLATRLGLAAGSLLVQAMLAYMLLPEGRGAYAVCLVFGTLLGLVFTPGALQGAQHFVITRQASVSQAVSAAFLISIAGGGLAVALALPMIHSAIPFFQKADTHTFHLALALIPITIFSAAVEHQLPALRRFARLGIFSMLRVATNVLLLMLLVWGLGWGVDGAVLSLAAGHLVMIALCLWDLWRHCGLAPEFPLRSRLTLILGYGLRYHAAGIGNAVESHISVLLLGLIASQAEIGLFAAASMLMLGFLVISNAVGNALLPRITGQERPELAARCMRLVSLATASVMLCFLALSTPLVRIVLSEAFSPAVPLLWVLAPGIFAYATAGILMTYFKAVNRPAACSWAVALGLGMNLVLLPLLYPSLGIAAAAWATTIGMICRCVFLVVLFKKITGFAWYAVWLPERADAVFLWEAGQAAFRRRSATVERTTAL